MHIPTRLRSLTSHPSLALVALLLAGPRVAGQQVVELVDVAGPGGFITSRLDITGDTAGPIAKALFRNGQIDAAIRWQEIAIAEGGRGDADYSARLKQYREAKAARDRQRDEQQPKRKN